MPQDILINPNSSGDPTIRFIGSGNNATPITLKVLSNYQTATGSGSAIVFDGSEGRLFSITDNLSSGIIFNVGNISGLSLLNASASGDVKIAEFGRYVGVGYGTPSYGLDVFTTGNFRQLVIFNSGINVTGNILVNNTGVSLSGHVHTASQITDFNEAVDDRIGSGLFVAGTGIALTYNDSSNTFTVSATGLVYTTGTGGSNSIIPIGVGATASAGYNNVCGGLNNNAGGAGFNGIVNGLNNNISGAGVFDIIVGGSTNAIPGGDRSFIGGGSSITISGNDNATVGGGGHTTYGSFGFIGGGATNNIRLSSSHSSIIGGGINSISGTYNSIGGGRSNAVSGSFNSIIGGSGNNIASGSYSSIVGGQNNNNDGYSNVFILGSNITATQADTTYVQNLDVSTTGDIDTLKINKFYHNNLSVATGVSDGDLLITIVNPTGSSSTQVISGSGLRSTLLNQPAVLRFRQGTNAERLLITPATGEPIWTTDTQRFYIGDGSTVGGDFIGPGPYTYAATGYTNVIPIHSTIGYASGDFSNILGGYNNTVSGMYLSVINGLHNRIIDNTGTTVSAATIVGGTGNLIREGLGCAIVGGYRNTVSGGSASTIVGGGDAIFGGNSIIGSRNFIGGGAGNNISGNNSIIVGGGFRGPTALYGNAVLSNFGFIGAGDRNTIYSGSWMSNIVGGYLCSISSGCSASTIGGGYVNNISQVTGITVNMPVFGSINLSAQTIGGGYANNTAGAYSTIPGGYRGKTSHYGELSHAAGFFQNFGDAQHTILIARRSTTDNTANQVLFLNNDSLNAGETNYEKLTIAAKTTWTFEIKLSAYNDTDSAAAGWIFRGVIKRDGSNNTTIVGSIVTESWYDSAMNSTNASVVANDTDESLDILVTGLTSKNIRWVAVTDISQVSYGTP